METILSVNGLSKKFGYIKAVQNLTFSIEKGNVYGILGPNGSGKSTTLGIILNVVNATSGKFSWFDGTVSTHEALKRVGAIIERPNFYPYMTAVQNLKLVCKIKEVSEDKIQEKLELVGLWETFNLQIARVVESTPSEELTRLRTDHALDQIAWERMPADEPATLEAMIEAEIAIATSE